VLLPVGLNFLMWNIGAGDVWFKLFPGLHKISGDCSTEISYKRKSISCMFHDLCIPRLFLIEFETFRTYFICFSYIFPSSVMWLLKSVTVDISLNTRVIVCDGNY
jgi:hypothetical protein